MVEVIDERIHDLQSPIFEDQYILTGEEDGPVLLELVVWVIIGQFFIEPECAEAAVENVTEILVAEVFRFDVVTMFLVDLPQALPPRPDLLADVQVGVLVNHMQFVRGRTEILVLLLYELHQLCQLLILLHFQLVLSEELCYPCHLFPATGSVSLHQVLLLRIILFRQHCHIAKRPFYSEHVHMIPMNLSIPHLIQILQNTLQIKPMLKLKNNSQGNRITKKTIRPFSACAFVNKKNRSSHLLNNIITSLERNVNDLKIYSQKKDVGLSQEKSQKGFRVKRGMVRNSSQVNLQPPREDRCQNDVFEIRNEYLKANGRLTNNIIELYEFYRKNTDKREKSTRILASMELSNGGQSISGGKESLLKHSQLYRDAGKKDKDQSKIDEKNEESNNFDNSSKSPAKLKKVEKTSVLANELISKGCYNLMNIANLLNSKKYRLTKEKQDSFKRPKNQKNYTQKNKQIIEVVESKEMSMNKENNMNRDNIIREPQEMSIAQPNEFNISRNSNFNITKSPEFHKKPQSAQLVKDSEQPSEKVSSKSKSFECSSISKQDKDIQRKIFEETSIKKAEGSNQKNFSKIKPQLQLLQSPIIPKNPKQFQKSKFYVKPIPQKKYENQNSISLRSTSRIIDIDSLPFDL